MTQHTPEIISSKSGKSRNPRTLVYMPCMAYEFSTGHKVIKWSDGEIFHHKKDGTAMNVKTGSKIIPLLNEAIAKAEDR